MKPGTRLGPYEIVSPLGAGGMGEVYRARDSRLHRDVAVKVLPDALMANEEHAARFEREARVLATLTHPNIAAIYGVEDSPAACRDDAGGYALVLELVEGPTLAERLAEGPLPPDEALAIAEQIADALEAAHEKGIVHRDLKPSNVKITPHGVVKVLDFGLAKIVADVADSAGAPTLLATQANLVVGTPAYMAPEQVHGKAVDARADIWAFGVVLYEMVAGNRPFQGASVGETLAAVLGADPDWDRIPVKFQPLLRRCLARNPRERLRHIGDFRLLIDDGGATDRRVARSKWSVPVQMSLVITAITILAVTSGWLHPRVAVSPESVHLTMMLPPGVSVTRGPGFASSVALSPDGRTLVIAGSDKDGQRLYRRRLDAFDAAPLAGTDGGSSPFFSPDGEWVGFFADGRIRRVPAAGGAAVDITPVSGFLAGASWGADDRIVFAAGPSSRLHSVHASGGDVELVPGVESGYHPEVLPDGRTLLFESAGWIHMLDRVTGRQHRIVQGVTPRYADGRVIFSRGTTLLGAPLDLSRQELTGAVAPVEEGVAFEASTVGLPHHYAIASSGTLAYVPAAGTYVLALIDAGGTERLVGEPQPRVENPQFAPDGRHVVVALTRRDGQPADLWLHDLQTGGPPTRLTFDGGRAPVWMPDGLTVTYSHVGKDSGIYTKRADGRGDARQLLALDAFHWIAGWTPDGQTLAYGLLEGSQSSILALTAGRSHRVVPSGSNWGGRLSRDGRWLAYYSLDSGSFEVYVTPFPEGGTRWLIAAGTDPKWGVDDSEVYYRSGARLMAARIDKRAGVRVLSHRAAIEPFLPPLYDDYDIHADGRLLVVGPAGSTQPREVRMILNWFPALRRLVGQS